MNGIKKILNKYSKGKIVLLLFILTNIVYALMLMVTIPKTMAFSKGMKLLDMMPTGYSSEYISTLFDTLGKNGREVYLYNQIPLDMIYPILFGITYCLVMAYFLKRLDRLNTGWFFLCLLPLLAGVADYLENIGVITMLRSYPDLSQASMAAANFFTILKSMVTTIYFVVLVVILILFGIEKLKKRDL